MWLFQGDHGEVPSRDGSPERRIKDVIPVVNQDKASIYYNKPGRVGEPRGSGFDQKPSPYALRTRVVWEAANSSPVAKGEHKL